MPFPSTWPNNERILSFTIEVIVYIHNYILNNYIGVLLGIPESTNNISKDKTFDFH